MVERGVIRNRDRARQIVDFHDLRWGKITPTDIDGLLDFGNKVFVCIEYKYEDAEMGYGQELAFKRLVDALSKPCILIQATHSQHDPNKDIDGANARVVRVYYKGKWYPSKHTVRQVIDTFLEKISAPKSLTQHNL